MKKVKNVEAGSVAKQNSPHDERHAEQNIHMMNFTSDQMRLLDDSDDRRAQPILGYGVDIKNSSIIKLISYNELAELVKRPTVGEKRDAAYITTHDGHGKTKAIAETTYHNALFLDDDSTGSPLLVSLQRFDGYECIAYTTTYHQIKDSDHPEARNRTRVVVLYSRSVSAEHHIKLAVGFARLFGTDLSQARIQQVAFLPNKLSDNAPYEWLRSESRVLLDPYDDTDPLISAALAAYEEYIAGRESQARSAPVNEKPALIDDIISLVNSSYSMREVLESFGYEAEGGRLLYPHSESGIAGVYLFKGDDGRERVYSHHKSDPLCDGKSHDVFDVICILQYDGDLTVAVRDQADKLDPDGQRRRRKNYAAERAAKEALTAFKYIDENGEEVDVEPVDLLAKFNVPAFDTSLLPTSIGAYADDQAELMGIDPSIIGIACIVSAAAAIDDRVTIQPKKNDPTWTESPRLWGAVVGDPSVMKSPGIAKAVAPLKRHESQFRKEFLKEYKAWKQKAEGVKDKSQLPPEPVQKRLLVADATVEKIGMILAEQPPRGILCFQDELNGLLAGMDAYKNGQGKDRAAWLEAYNGGSMTVDRVSRGSLYVENWSISVLGGIQPEVIHAYAKNTNHDGMLQRMIIVEARAAVNDVDRAPDTGAQEAYDGVIDRLLAIDPAWMEQTVVTLSEGAQQVRNEFKSQVSNLIRVVENAPAKAALAKWNGLFSRLLLVYHCIDTVDEHGDLNSMAVSAEQAQRVSNLMLNVLLHHLIKFYSGMDTAGDHAKELSALILAQGWDRFTVKRDLNRYWKISRNLPAWSIDAVLDRLEAFSWIYPDGTAKLNERGRASAYLINPLVHTLFSERADAERQRRAEIVEQMEQLNLL